MATPPVFSAGAVLTATQMNSVGLWLVKKQTFSATATWQVTSCFTSDYVDYRIIVDCTTGAGSAAQIQTQMLVGTTATAGSSYAYYYSGISFGGTVDAGGSNGTSNWFALRTAGSYWSGVMDIRQPQAAQRTWFNAQGVDTTQKWESGGFHDSTTQFDGIQFKNSGASNMTGTVYVYGYRP